LVKKQRSLFRLVALYLFAVKKTGDWKKKKPPLLFVPAALFVIVFKKEKLNV
jgi:hypothetical protein